ncbi:LysR family transcriptional regulator, glycine cleavage system transcriptional activator [Variovorax sp. YR750]|uniref:LysR family transcriptional regulator n=1 Tax=Variovorax gossypii TaxID=1679495 RepID=A0A431TLQ1_9BURK|nr:MULTISPECIES: LysR family transcriptional regulator [Variovorax]RTQ34612.1 LysR family transcriptional regulator [Variovorax gossypii]SEK90411.1 LysR family transcriptional regulator, glycine cleavage system transcriptional activator [Variovorax sp. YR750]
MPLAPPRPRLPPHTAVRAFEAAARHGSFARAAEELFVTPAAVAQQIKALETWAGGALFERHSQGIRLSAHGRRALPALSAAVDQLGLAVQALRHETQIAARRSTLQVAALPAVAQLWLSPRLSRLKAELPGVQVSVTALEQPPNFRREPFDLGLFYARAGERIETDAGAQAIPLVRDRLLPVCSPRLRQPLPSGRPRPPEDLIELLERNGGLHDTVWRDDWQRWLQAVRPGTTAAEAEALAAGPDFSLYSLALQAALDGEGVLMGRERLVAPLLAQGKLHAPWGRPKALGDTVVLLVPAHRKGPLLARQVQALQALTEN